MRQNKNELGFIPMLVLLLIVLGAVVWFAFKHVNDAHKAQDAVNQIQKVQKNEDIINR